MKDGEKDYLDELIELSTVDDLGFADVWSPYVWLPH